MSTHHHILIVGGGNAGISVAAQLLIKDKSLDIAIIDPSDKHYYQPAWTLVGSGAFNIQDTERSESSVIPAGAKWIQEAVESFDPENNSLSTTAGHQYTYDYMVVAPGIQLDWASVKGLPEALGHDGVSSNYSFQTAPYTFEMIKNLKKGKAIFHNPHTPVKCGGAPHKIMYMASDYWRKNGVLNDIDIQYWSGAGKLFAVPKYEKTLLNVAERGHVGLNFMQRLEEIDGPNKKAKFVAMAGDNQGEETWVDYDIIHVTPPQSSPNFIKKSPLANAGGWVDVDKHTLQHPKFSNVFTLGDASGLPTSKTGAAIRKQAPVLVENLLAVRGGATLNGNYTGYTSCPLVTGYGKLVLAEFDYDGNPMETFPFDQSKERWSMYLLKRRVLPWLYWNKILAGTD
ncbi:MAG: FAD/NAD(P)-binding oxidoreductase [Bacteroidetes bacterium]|nr:FAD/NAD(P)-binding oxidoreductase [Bacteroidota bacterium]MDA0943452.1 FAD/NAD(P)-binding oxidoreductase [Bacteroidota bacterium]MDA1111689.1 FAD/NAD(P)-binding oxidoreductase [Bacteroidota bacterium]